jgi:hypothetical protein
MTILSSYQIHPPLPPQPVLPPNVFPSSARSRRLVFLRGTKAAGTPLPSSLAA